MLLGIAAGTWALDFAGLAASAAAVLPTVPWAGVIIGFPARPGRHCPAGAARGAGQAEVGLLDSLAAAGVNLAKRPPPPC
jgi:hypothetical protein